MNDARYDVFFYDISSERLAMIILAGHAKPETGHLERAFPEVKVRPPAVPPIHIPHGGSVTVDDKNLGYDIHIVPRGTYRKREDVMEDLRAALAAAAQLGDPES